MQGEEVPANYVGAAHVNHNLEEATCTVVRTTAKHLTFFFMATTQGH